MLKLCFRSAKATNNLFMRRIICTFVARKSNEWIRYMSPKELREFIANRAKGNCEYCKCPAKYSTIISGENVKTEK